MVITIIAIISLLIGVLNAAMDIIEKQYNQSIFANIREKQHWLNPSLSWKNKWKDGKRELGEKFLFSSTILVMFTDFWHLLKTSIIMLIGIEMYIISNTEITIWLMLFNYAIYVITFELFFTNILRQKEMRYSKFLNGIKTSKLGVLCAKLGKWIGKHDFVILLWSILLSAISIAIMGNFDILIFGILGIIFGVIAFLILIIMLIYTFIINPLNKLKEDK